MFLEHQRAFLYHCKIHLTHIPSLSGKALRYWNEQQTTTGKAIIETRNSEAYLGPSRVDFLRKELINFCH